MNRLTSLLSRYCFFLLVIGFTTNGLKAQTTVTPPGNDSLQEVEILNATRTLTFKTVDDTTKLTIIAGDVKLRQGKTLFYCDSCVINNNTHLFEAWGKNGKVHINDADTTHIYSSHLRYLMEKRLAYLDGGVRMTDGHATLTTPDLEYDMETNIGIYRNGGKVVNKNTTLTSQEGWYYADMKDVYFKKNVHLKDPAYTIETDSLLYNSESQTTRFISMTTIVDSSGRTIKTREGYYDQRTGKAEFGQNPVIVDGQTEIRGRTITIDDSSGIARVDGNAIIVDKKNKTTLIAGTIFRNRKTEAVLAVRKPLLIIQQDNDSIYISADTLFSAKLTDLYRTRGIRFRSSKDSTFQSTDSLRGDTSRVTMGDSLKKGITDSMMSSAPPGNIANDTLVTAATGTDSTAVTEKAPGQAPPVANRNNRGQGHRQLLLQPPPKDSLTVQTQKGMQVMEINESDSSNRYFEAYRNVRIFNDSLQARCDSMFYSFKDSVFRLYDDPVVWAQKSQITGDTIHLFTKNRKADKVEAIENSFMISQLDDQAFNQIKSSRMDGYFIDGNIDSVRARGSAECIYYIQDDDSAYSGINESKSDIIDIYFENKELSKVVFRSAVTGTLWPMKEKGPEEMRLPGFQWLEDRRPKSKLEMYE